MRGNRLVQCIGAAVAGLLICGAAVAAEGHWQATAKHVAAAVDDIEAMFAAGDTAAARTALTEAYFGRFEDSKMEAAIRKEIGGDRAIEVEGMFGKMRKAIKAGDAKTVEQTADALRQALAADAKALDAAGVPAEVYEVNR